METLKNFDPDIENEQAFYIDLSGRTGRDYLVASVEEAIPTTGANEPDKKKVIATLEEVKQSALYQLVGEDVQQLLDLPLQWIQDLEAMRQPDFRAVKDDKFLKECKEMLHVFMRYTRKDDQGKVSLTG